MKKSKFVPATFVATIAAVALTGCGERRDCVDVNGNVLPDSACTSGSYAGHIYPHWIYGGSMSNGRVTGGSTTPHTSSGVSRGGLGGGHSTFGG
jgi:hypothetical protein